MKTLRQAVIEALEHCEKWTGGAVVVADGEGRYEAVPGAYLSDISYTGPREVVWRVAYLSDVAGNELPTTDAGTEYLADMVIYDLERS
ncbi:MAG: hypothetical protein H5T69_00250 [Chloroflexi bacterium]|nr:hypothetical protein [Chloroflexota bacterium]